MPDRLVCTAAAWTNLFWWQGQDRKTLKRINLLIQDAMRHPFDGIGKPEPLRENLSVRRLVGYTEFVDIGNESGEFLAGNKGRRGRRGSSGRKLPDTWSGSTKYKVRSDRKSNRLSASPPDARFSRQSSIPVRLLRMLRDSRRA